MNKAIKVLLIMLLVVTTLLTKSGAVSADGGPFTCSPDFYQEINGQLKLLNPITGQYSNIGAQQPDYNAMGFDTLDNYIYAIRESNGDLVRIGSDGTETDLGALTGIPSQNYVNASFDAAGNMYIYPDDSSNTLYKIDVDTLTATTLNITGDTIINGDDSAYLNGNLYFLNGSTLSVVDLNNNTDNNVTVSGPSGWLTAGGIFGAAWSNQSGELYFSNNTSGDIYQITNYDTSSPTATFEVTGTVTSDNDGANCITASGSTFDPPSASNYTFTTPVDTTLNETATSILAKDVGSSLTITAHTNPAHGKLTLNADGTFTYVPNNGFVGTDSYNYTVTDAFGRTASAVVSINVTPPVAPQSPDTGYGTPTSYKLLYIVSATVALIFMGAAILYLNLRKQRDIFSKAI